MRASHIMINEYNPIKVARDLIKKIANEFMNFAYIHQLSWRRVHEWRFKENLRIDCCYQQTQANQKWNWKIIHIRTKHACSAVDV